MKPETHDMFNMKPETHVWVHLPNGDKFEMDRNNDYSPLSEDAVSEIRNLFGGKEMTNIEFRALPEKNNGLQKGKVIILWGDTLKNSWIEIVNY